MKFYLAPMEGITGYIYRRAYATYYNHVDKYFSPFIQASQQSVKTKEWKDILPENNKGISLVPQLLTNNASDFIYMSKRIKDLGYDEINLNLGCPSGTVVSKYRGSGFLAKPEELHRFLDEIFSAGITKISIKTRLGKDNDEGFEELMKIYNQYPMTELIIHPRIQQDFYKNKPRLEKVQYALEVSKNPLCYNGDIFSYADYESIISKYPEISMVMLGRGLIADPRLVGKMKGIEEVSSTKDALGTLRKFHDKLYHDYQEVLSGDTPLLYKMKELWIYLHTSFTEPEKYIKKIKKANRLSEYEEVVHRIFEEQSLIDR